MSFLDDGNDLVDLQCPYCYQIVQVSETWLLSVDQVACMHCNKAFKPINAEPVDKF